MSNYYRQRFDGEWVDVTTGRVGACCDCGLVHQEEYIILKGKNGDLNILRRVFRLNKDTADRRRSMKARKEGLFSQVKADRKKGRQEDDTKNR